MVRKLASDSKINFKLKICEFIEKKVDITLYCKEIFLLFTTEIFKANRFSAQGNLLARLNAYLSL